MTHEEIKQVERNFSRLSVVVAGDHAVDVNATGFWGSKVSREVEGLPIFLISGIDYQPGGAGNLISNLAYLNIQSRALGFWGDKSDVHRKILEDHFIDKDIDTFGMVIGSRTPTFGKFFLANGTHVNRADTIIPEIPIPIRLKLVHKFQLIKKSVRFIIVADYNEIGTGMVVPELLKEVGLTEIPTFGLSRERIETMIGFDYLILNEVELNSVYKRLVRKPITDEELLLIPEMNKICRLIFATKTKRCVIVTHGGEGAASYGIKKKTEPIFISEDGLNYVFVPSEELVDNIDCCGAGDTLTAVFAAARISKYGIITSLRLANSASRAVVRKRFGTGYPSFEEIRLEYTEIYGDQPLYMEDEEPQ
jgi:bifunctional ADP-heptose synthase (sugar kinase/adenylyltransferase)